MPLTLQCLSEAVCKLQKELGGNALLVEEPPSSNFLRVASAVAEGQTVTIAGYVFEVDTDGTVTAPNIAINLQASSAAAATSTLTSTGAATTIGDTLTIGSTVYTFKDTLTTAYDVARGANAAATLANLKMAIDGTGTAGTNYFAGTLAHPTVKGGALTSTTLGYIARVKGTAGNAIATTDTAATLSTTSTVLAGGVDATAAQFTAAFALAVNSNPIQGVTAPYSTANSVVVSDAFSRPLPVSETLTGTNNAWNNTTFTGGVASVNHPTVTTQRAVVAAEVTVGIAVFSFNFAVNASIVQVRTSAGVVKQWAGVKTQSGNTVILTNNGGTDFAATDIITIAAQ